MADDIPEAGVPSFFIIVIDELAQLLESLDEHFQKFAGSKEFPVNHEKDLGAGDLLYK